MSFGTRWLGRPREHWAELGSTNDRALAWARAGAPHGALVTADAQTAGRGRLGRAWASESGEDLYVSMVLRPGPGRAIGALALAVGAGLREGLSAWLPAARLKWPNDVLASGRKLAGILCEARWVGSSPEVVAGFGVNVGRQVFPGPLTDTATSLHRELGAAPERGAVLQRVLVTIEATLDDFFRGGFPAIRGRYEPHCALTGQRVLVDMSSETCGKMQAIALGLADDGALLVAPTGGGPPRRVESGDVWLAPEAQPVGE